VARAVVPRPCCHHNHRQAVLTMHGVQPLHPAKLLHPPPAPLERQEDTRMTHGTRMASAGRWPRTQAASAGSKLLGDGAHAWTTRLAGAASMSGKLWVACDVSAQGRRGRRSSRHVRALGREGDEPATGFNGVCTMIMLK
jgi:hypothetical protein